MLFAVEGGGFFSSSASGYSKGLTLLLLGQRNEDKPMRVSPWNHYQLVDQESDLDLQLASTKNRISRGCASFVCFGRTSAGLDAPTIPKVGPATQQDIQPENVVPENSEDCSNNPNNDSNATKTALRSSLKKPTSNNSESCEVSDELEASGENGSNIPGHTERRKVQWTDACGSDLVEIREFEPSEIDGSDDELNDVKESCSCIIM